MKNRLKNTFSHDTPTALRGTIHFKDNNHYVEFLHKLDLLDETGEAQKIDGVEELVMNQNICGKEYPLAIHNNLTEVHVYPTIDEEFKIHVITEFEEYTWKLSRTQSKAKTTSKTYYKKIVTITIDYSKKDKNTNLTITTKPEEAESAEEIAKAYSATIALLIKFTAEPDGDLGASVLRLKNVIEYSKRIMELEKCFNISFNPQVMKDNREGEETAEELYLAIIKGKIIRENRSISSLELEENDKNKMTIKTIKPGVSVSFCFQFATEMELFGASLTIYYVSVLSNAIIDSLENDEISKKYTLKMKNSDSLPAYISYRAFLSEDAQKSEMERLTSNYIENVKEYIEARTLYQHIRDR